MKLANTTLSSLGKKKQFTWTVNASGFCFSKVLKADLDDRKFPRSSSLLQYGEDLRLCSPSQDSSQENSTHLLKILALKGHKVTKEKH